MKKKLVYHVDRRGCLDKIEKGDAIRVCAIDNPFYSNLLAGDKVSYHGNFYLNQWGISDGKLNLRGDALWELFAEMIRIKSFPQLKSRYNALFGFENPEDLKSFIGFQNILPFSQRKVYVLEVSDYLQRDMAQFGSGDDSIDDGTTYTSLDNQLIKHCYDYWSGATTKNPVIETLIYGEAIVNEVIEVREFMSGMIS